MVCYARGPSWAPVKGRLICSFSQVMQEETEYSQFKLLNKFDSFEAKSTTEIEKLSSKNGLSRPLSSFHLWESTVFVDCEDRNAQQFLDWYLE